MPKGYRQDKSINMNIVGTVNTGTKAIYFSDHLIKLIDINMFYLPHIDNILPQIEFYDENIVDLNTTRQIPSYQDKSIEIYVSENISDETLNNIIRDYKVIGFYKEDDNVVITQTIYVDKSLAEEIMYGEIAPETQGKIYNELSVYVKDKIKLTATQNQVLINEYDYLIGQIKETKNERIVASISYIIISIIVSFLIIYFLVRSSISLRIKEVSVLRSLGKSKREIRQLFNLEMLILTTISSFIGFIIGAFIASKIDFFRLGGIFNINITLLTFIVVLLLVYTINMFANLLPVNALLRKTPAEMLTNYDL